jgi:hypothetical protein
MFKDMMMRGPPRQKITVIYGGKAQEYVIPNSAEDEKLFRAEIKWFNKLDMRYGVARSFDIYLIYRVNTTITIYQEGDVEKTNLKWSKMREGRKYVAELD